MRTQQYILDRMEDYRRAKEIANAPEDIQWINLLLQELEWIRQVETGEFTHDCVLAQEDALGTTQET